MAEHLAVVVHVAPGLLGWKDVAVGPAEEARDVRRDVAPHITSFLGRTDRDIFPAEQARRYMDNDREVLRHGKPLTFDEASYDADGTVRQWFTMKFPDKATPIL